MGDPSSWWSGAGWRGCRRGSNPALLLPPTEPCPSALHNALETGPPRKTGSAGHSATGKAQAPSRQTSSRKPSHGGDEPPGAAAVVVGVDVQQLDGEAI